jgi:hypothetical protein
MAQKINWQSRNNQWSMELPAGSVTPARDRGINVNAIGEDGVAVTVLFQYCEFPVGLSQHIGHAQREIFKQADLDRRRGVVEQ